MKSINDDLFQLYNSHWDLLLKEASRLEAGGVKIACPLLIQVHEEDWRSADLRVMYVGQETWGWVSELGDSSMDECLRIYKKYFLNEEYLLNSRKSVFWRSVKNFDGYFSDLFQGKQVVGVWNNVAKIGLHGKKGMRDCVRDFGHQFFPVFAREVEILAPDVIVFMTGPYRDKDIRQHFPAAKMARAVDSIPARQLAAVEIPGFSGVAVRTYHPRYFGGFGRILKDVKTVFDQRLQSRVGVPTACWLSIE